MTPEQEKLIEICKKAGSSAFLRPNNTVAVWPPIDMAQFIHNVINIVRAETLEEVRQEQQRWVDRAQELLDIFVEPEPSLVKNVNDLAVQEHEETQRKTELVWRFLLENIFIFLDKQIKTVL